MIPQTEVVFPIVYGSMAFSMGTKKTETSTHKWICYVRGINNEDLSYLIRKVEFVLHSSFDEPVKTVEHPPFQVKRDGWGEFQIMIRVYFQHPTMPHIEVPHMLKLHHTHASSAQAAKKPLCSQTYDEIVFTIKDQYIEKMIQGRDQAQKLESSPDAQSLLDQGDTVGADQPLKTISSYSRYFMDIKPEDHRIKLEDALKFIVHEIKTSQQKMRNADTDIQKVYDDIYSRLP